MSRQLSTIEMMKEIKETGKVAIIVEVPSRLEPHKENWLGSGMFYDEQFNRYCVNKWIKNFGYPSFEENELAKDEIRKEIKWMIDETVEKSLPPNTQKTFTEEEKTNIQVVENQERGHLFKKGDQLKVENEEAIITILELIVQDESELGYWINVKKLDGSYNGMKTMHEKHLKDLPLLS